MQEHAIEFKSDLIKKQQQNFSILSEKKNDKQKRSYQIQCCI